MSVSTATMQQNKIEPVLKPQFMNVLFYLSTQCNLQTQYSIHWQANVTSKSSLGIILNGSETRTIETIDRSFYWHYGPYPCNKKGDTKRLRQVVV